MQQSRFLLGPNTAYDRFTGFEPSACSSRDLVLELHGQLAKRGLRLMLYWTCDGPSGDRDAHAALGWSDNHTAGCSFSDCAAGHCECDVPAVFLERWSAVLQECQTPPHTHTHNLPHYPTTPKTTVLCTPLPHYATTPKTTHYPTIPSCIPYPTNPDVAMCPTTDAERYGDKVSGWWIDGCFRRPYSFTESSLKPFHDAVKAGNPKAIVGFNNGVHHPIGRFPDRISRWEDITTGESDDFTEVPEGRFVTGACALL